MECIVDHLRSQAMALGDRRLLTESGRDVSYAEFYREVCRMAHYLHTQGVGKGDRILLIARDRMPHLATYFAGMALGAIPVHTHIGRPVDFLHFAAEKTGAKLFVSQNYAEDWTGFPCPVVGYPEFGENAPERWTEDRSECAYMMFTSGTTGRPKAVMTSQSNLMFTAGAIINFASLQGPQRELICLPLSFTFGLGHFHAQILLGGQAHLTQAPAPGDRNVLLPAMENDDIDGFLASPAMIRELLTTHREGFLRAARNLKYIVVNCTPMPVELTRELLDALPKTRHYMYYGMTEASRSAFNYYNGDPSRIKCTGKATEGMTLKIDNPNANGEGEVCMKGPNVMMGYWGDPDATAEAIDADGWMHSGDLGIMDELGYITVLGRVKDQISVDGMKCQPLEVEEVLNDHPEVKASAVVAVPDAERYQLVGALVVPAEAQPAADLEARLQAHCLDHLAEAYKVPVHIAFAGKVPSNELGKIRRNEVLEIVQQTWPVTS